MTVSTWNPSDKSASITLSNGNDTATGTSTALAGVRGTQSKNSGLLYFEINTITLTSSNSGIGIANSSKSFTAEDIGEDAAGNSIGYFGGFGVYYKAANAFGNSAGGDSILSIAIDFTHKTFWLRQGSSTWNDSGTANPATNTGGVDITTLLGAGDPFPCLILKASGDAGTLNTSGPFTETMPSGFSAWDGTAADSVTITTSFGGLAQVFDVTEATKATIATHFSGLAQVFDVTEATKATIATHFSGLAQVFDVRDAVSATITSHFSGLAQVFDVIPRQTGNTSFNSWWSIGP